MSDLKTNWVVDGAVSGAGAMHGAVYWAVNGAVYRAVGEALNGAVYWTVYDAVSLDLWGAGSRAAHEDSAHPALQDFLVEAR